MKADSDKYLQLDGCTKGEALPVRPLAVKRCEL